MTIASLPKMNTKVVDNVTTRLVTLIAVKFEAFCYCFKLLFLPFDEAVASRAVFIIVPGSDEWQKCFSELAQ